MFKQKGGGSKAFWTMLKKTALFLKHGFPYYHMAVIQARALVLFIVLANETSISHKVLISTKKAKQILASLRSRYFCTSSFLLWSDHCLAQSGF